MHTSLRIQGLLVGGVVASLLVPFFVSAAIFEAGQEYTLTSDEEVTEDIYVAAGSVAITGNIEGDLVATGGSILVQGDVSEDVMVAGGSVDITGGNLGDDVRVAGGTVLINSHIAGDLIVFGGQVRILPGVVIEGDVRMYGGEISFAGSARQDVVMYGGVVRFSGEAEGNVALSAGQSVVIEETAVIRGALAYTAPEEITIPEGADIRGEITYSETPLATTTPRDVATGLAAFLAIMALVKLVLVAVAGVVLVLLFRRFTDLFCVHTAAHFGVDLLRGFVVLIIVPILVVLLLFTVIGGMLAGLLGILYALLLMVGNIYAGISLAALVKKYLFSRDVQVGWAAALGGITVLHILGLIPIIGWIVKFIFFIAALGALVYLLQEHVWRKRS